MGNLKELRTAANKTLQQVVEDLVSRGHKYRGGRSVVSAWECGKSLPPVTVIRDLADIYQASCLTVLDLLTEPKPALIPAEELARAEAELQDLEARIARLKAEVGNA